MNTGKTRVWLYVLLWVIALNTCETNYRVSDLEKTWDQRILEKVNA